MQKTLTKADIIDSICARNTRNRGEIRKIVEDFFSLVRESLAKEGEVLLTGFGKFECYAKSSRRGRNPQTEEAIILPPRKVVVFRVSRKFREDLNARISQDVSMV